MKDPYRFFRVEAKELLDGLSQGVLELEQGPADARELVARVLRLAHTLKGAARVVKCPAIADLAHALEDAFAARRDGGPASREQIDGLLALLDAIGHEIAALDAAPPAAGLGAAPASEPVPAAPPPAPRGPAEPPPAFGDPPSEPLGALPPPIARAPTLTPPGGVEPIEAGAAPGRGSVRVDIEQIDTLLEGIAGAGEELASIRRAGLGVSGAIALALRLAEQLRQEGRGSGLAEELCDALGRAREDLGAGVTGLETELRGLVDQAGRLRLVPARLVFGQLERVARDTARALGKRVELVASGGDHALDGHVLARVRDALLHIVRNAVDHGIEPEAERLALGKPAAGRVEVRVEQSGAELRFVCADDGRGVDVGAVLRSAERLGLAPPGQPVGAADAHRLVFHPGLSTRAEITAISGRGVGLDAAREIALALGGGITAESTPGRGTRIQLVAPVTLASVRALLVQAAGAPAAIPLSAVACVARLDPAALTRSDGRDAVLHEGAALDLIRFDRLLARPAPRLTFGAPGRLTAPSAPNPPAPPGAPAYVVVLQAGGARVALGVDRLSGTAELILRPLPPLLADLPLLGASFDLDGALQPVLDPQRLLDCARAAGVAGPAAVAAPARPPPKPLLVIDDSLTTRMLEQSILEAAGYQVDLASSAEEALERARRRDYGLFIVDVEMPGMSGYEFVARTREDPALRFVPSIIVSSLASPEDRRRGREAGARAYIVKEEFAQDAFLELIRDLTAGRAATGAPPASEGTRESGVPTHVEET